MTDISDEVLDFRPSSRQHIEFRQISEKRSLRQTTIPTRSWAFNNHPMLQSYSYRFVTMFMYQWFFISFPMCSYCGLHCGIVVAIYCFLGVSKWWSFDWISTKYSIFDWLVDEMFDFMVNGLISDGLLTLHSSSLSNPLFNQLILPFK